MLMGVDVEGISVIIFVRVMNMTHYILQGKSSSDFFLNFYLQEHNCFLFEMTIQPIICPSFDDFHRSGSWR